MPAKLRREDAERILAPHLSALCDPIYAAWREWGELTPALRQPLSERTRANWIYDMTVKHAKATLDRPPSLTFTEQPGFLAVTVEDAIAIRYKKLDDERGICGIRTGQLDIWRAQEPIPGMNGVLNLVAGHHVSELGRLESVEIVCLRGYHALWSIEAPPASANVATLVPAPVPETKVRPRRREDGNAAAEA